MFAWFTVLGLIFIAASVSGNGSVILVIAFRRRLPPARNFLLLSLASADISLAVSSIWNCTTCKKDCACGAEKPIVFFVNAFFVISSVTCLLAVILERWVAIVLPLKYTNLTIQWRVCLTIALTSAFPVLLHFPPIVHQHVVRSEEQVGTPPDREGYLWFLLVSFDLVPCLVLLISSLHVLCITRSQSRQIAVLRAQVRFNSPRLAYPVCQNDRRN